MIDSELLNRDSHNSKKFIYYSIDLVATTQQITVDRGFPALVAKTGN